MKQIWPLFLMSFVIACSHAKTIPDDASCVMQPDLQKEASVELQKMVAADQADRTDPTGATIDWSVVSPRDLKRRIKTAMLFAQGCFKEAADYSAAAMIYQHGDTADHAFQTFIWAKRATELGDNQKWLTAAGLDRYLVRAGHKQIFATQLTRDPGETCLCLEPTELSFPDKKRVEYTRLSLRDELDRMPTFWNKDHPACGKSYCKHDLKPTPSGTVPGFW